MTVFYNSFTSREKISIRRSMYVSVRKFMNQYGSNLSLFTHEEDLFNTLYFFWLRESARQHYYWCRQSNTLFLKNDFANEMKGYLMIEFKKKE